VIKNVMIESMIENVMMEHVIENIVTASDSYRNGAIEAM
jgi:hypothetical protein